MSKLRPTAIFLLVLALTGCQSAESLPKLNSVVGTITRNGKPVSAGGLIFVPEPPISTGFVVNANVVDGTFIVETSRSRRAGGIDLWPGAPTGTYKAIYHPPSNGAMSGLEVTFSELVKIEPRNDNQLSLTLPTAMPQGQGIIRDDDPDAGKYKNQPKK
jgi:hypothetical protein